MKKTPYVVLARKYRPRFFDEVLGQPAVSVTLKNALAAGRVAHAYLFTGPRGVGKTTMARILAKALNCAKGAGPAPCGDCEPCREIASSSSLDVLEMDAASHTGVDNVRQIIIETVGLAPSRDRYKVFIIDEAHMLSGAAFNALLKTLEEPPAHVVFVLATTESAKVPATVASRCQRFRFRPISVEDLAAHLAILAEKEGIRIEPEALALLARSAEGSLRDAVSLLDQCRSFTDQAITAALVREVFGFVPRDILLGLAQALIAKDAAALAGWLKRVYGDGIEAAQVLRDLRGALEGGYLEKLGVGAQADPAWSQALGAASAETLSFLLRRINKTLEDLRQGEAPRLTLELGLFGCLETACDLALWVERLEALERRLGASGAETARAAAPRPVAEACQAPRPAAAPGETWQAAWRGVIDLVRQEKPMLASALEGARVSASQDGPWRLVFGRGFELEQVKRGQSLVEAKLATACGRTVGLQLSLGAETDRSGQDAGAPAPADSSGETSADGGAWQDVGEAGPEKPAAESSLKKAEKILGGTVKFIKKKP